MLEYWKETYYNHVTDNKNVISGQKKLQILYNVIFFFIFIPPPPLHLYFEYKHTAAY